jgi:hypothetical protein
VRVCAFILVPLLLAACGGSPRTDFHTLVPVPAGQPTHGPAEAGSPIEVGRVDLPGILDRQWLVTRGPGTSIEVSDQHRWAAPLDELIRRALTADLRDRLGDSEVLAPGDPPPPGGARTLALNVQQFSGDSAGQVMLKADWIIGGPGPGRPAQAHHVDLRLDAGSANPDAVTAAMSQAVGKLADAIAAQV